MEVWFLESSYCGADCSEMYLHLKDTDIWLTDIGYDQEAVTNIGFTNLFWRIVNTGPDQDKLTYVGRI